MKMNSAFLNLTRVSHLLLFFTLLMTLTSFLPAETVYLSSLDIESVTQSWGTLQKNKDVAGDPLSIAGQPFENGLGTHANSDIVLELGGGSERFLAQVGVNGQALEKGSVEFSVHGDDKLLWESGIMRGGDAAKKINVSVKGVHVLILEVTDAEDGNTSDHADWIDARLEVTGTKPKSYALPKSEEVILTPKPGPKPQINGPTIFGVRPGSPFLYSIPATGERPITYSVDGLPGGLTLDPATGIITGHLSKEGTYPVTFHARNELGTSEKTFRIVVGDRIALTPPMGWNSWNCWGYKVSQTKVLSSARALVEKGLNQHGWIYINIDDGWQGVRGGQSNAIQPNAKFPDMKGLGDTLHAMGLRFGIYSTPWRGSYAGHIGSSSDNADGTYDWIKSGFHNDDFRINNNTARSNYEFGAHSFVTADVGQWAAWGVDYLKYDWYPIDVPHVQKMSSALKTSGRDIVFSLSNRADIANATGYAQFSNAWRTTHDITDSWDSVAQIGFNQDNWAPFQGPGHFNDEDMLVVGHVGWGDPHPTHLTPDEQYSHISLWALLSAPLLIGCDLDELDDFTLNLLTNDEVLAVNQDALVKQATRITKDGWAQVFAKPLEDGSWAVGLFNRGVINQNVTVDWSKLKLSPSSSHKVRDLWRQQDLGSFPEKFTAQVEPHGVVLIRVF